MLPRNLIALGSQIGIVLSSVFLVTSAGAFGEPTCATVYDAEFVGRYPVLGVPWSGPASDGASLEWTIGGNFDGYATSMCSTYGETGCTNAWITDIYNIGDISPCGDCTPFRYAFAEPVNVPTTEAACDDFVQLVAVYYHVRGDSYDTWTQETANSYDSSGVYQFAATWCSGITCLFEGCTMDAENSASGLPSLPTSGIDQVRVASLSYVYFDGPLQTYAGMYENSN